MQKLESIIEPENNSFNLVRLVAALAVLYSHSFLIPLGPEALEPLAKLTPFNLSQHAVNAFFVLSGLTLAKSIVTKPDIAAFLWARAVRILPALVAYGAIFAFVVGPFITKMNPTDYWSDIHTWLYPLAVPMFFQHATAPHEIFTDAPLAGAVNNPLWTIKYELAAYGALALCAAIGVLRTRVTVLLAAAILFELLIVFSSENDGGLRSALHQAARFGFCFILGVTAFFYRCLLPTSWVFLPITASLAFALRESILEKHAFLLLVAHLVIVTGALNFGLLTRWTRKNDISYGTYIYGWPTQQILVTAISAITPFALALASMLIVPLLGYVSWKIVERPALRLKLKQ